MKKLLAKLNSRSGASILLALLLFLVCALAGAAAITASASNVGRYSYLEGDQQQYLSAASAAKLIRSQLDGLKAEGKYSASVDPASAIDFVIGVDGKKQPVLEYKNVDTPTIHKVFSHDNEEISDIDHDFMTYFKGDLENALDSAFYSYFTQLPKNDPTQIGEFWNKAISNPEDYKDKLKDFDGKYSLEMYCKEIDGDEPENKVNVEIEITPPEEKTLEGGALSKEVKDGDTLDISVTVSLGETEFEMSGEMKITLEEVEDETKTETIERTFSMEDTGPQIIPGTPNPMIELPVSSTMMIRSTVKATATIEIDSLISRVHDEKEGVSS